MYSHHHPAPVYHHQLQTANFHQHPQSHHAEPLQMVPSRPPPPATVQQHHSPYQQPQQHQTRGPDPTGQAIHFTSGQFAGKTIRAELYEIQKADLGRKYARVDRRPLDPPPVVLLRMYEIFNAGTSRETEKEIDNYEEVRVLGFVCTVDLFPVPGPGHPDPENTRKSPSTTPSQTTFSTSPSSQFSDPSHHSYTFVVSPTYSVSESGTTTVTPAPPCQPIAQPLGYIPPTHAVDDVVYHINDFAVRESSKLTSALVGATFIQPSCVEYKGKKALVFVFADLAVKIEGTFILRYRIFDIYSGPSYNRDDLSIQAECYGGSFRIYSTKEFPGLQASTELTKHLARWGVRLNIRETERRRRKKDEHDSASPPARKGKRKHPSPESLNYPSDND
ncbi:velvet factor-domain-containing protein [Crucibulum laeve]|uniref:Velvet factor-domain-containing protein n=1 Tax=Crucibulum laeve TaxID=68775 RepID=A0A5C3LFH4_9AGAR|nr:velvet factor-domain-containing protein [Crucibulum laeve]